MNKRKYAFRAWDTRRKQWAFDWVIDGNGIVQTKEDPSTNCSKCIEDPWGDYVCLDYTNWRGIEDYIIQQWTGEYDTTTWEELSDEERERREERGEKKEDWKGRRIYEGDIVEYTDMDCKNIRLSGEIRFLNCRFSCNTLIGDRAFFADPKILGNICENPELRK